MYDRLSGYDYQHDIDSRVTKCSVGSFKAICEENSFLQVFKC
jgi:hypothetical protein